MAVWNSPGTKQGRKRGAQVSPRIHGFDYSEIHMHTFQALGRRYLKV